MNKSEEQEILLKVINLQKFFANKNGILKAVQNVSFDLEEGEILGLIGESGSGKTTLGRSLIRLYDDYNGFVSLDGNVISGKKISKKNRLFLHKNIQMIFQDPHTSMNSQKTVYSILKESLIINKVLKNKYKDIFSDWEQVKKFFKYTFIENYHKTSLENIVFENEVELDFISKWEKKLKLINTSESEFDEVFSEMFLFLESKQNMESKVVTKYFETTKKIFNSYLEGMEKYRKDDLFIDEKDLIEATENLKKVIKLSKVSLEREKLLEQIFEQKKYLKSFKFKQREKISRRKNTLKNYLEEFKNNLKLFLQQKNISLNQKDFLINYKWYLIYKKSFSLLSKNLNLLKYLTIEEISKLIEFQKNYNLRYFNSFENENKVNKKQILNGYEFSYKKELSKSNQTRITILNEKKEYKDNINELRKKMGSISKIPTYNVQDIEKAKLNLKSTKEKNDQELSEYLVKHSKTISKYKEDFIKAKSIQDEIKLKKESLDLYFQNLLNYFFKRIETEIFLEKNKHTINSWKTKTLSFKTRLFEKKDTLESFEIEKNLLKKEIKKLEHLLGMKENLFSKYFVKDIFAKEIIYSALEDVGLLRQFAYRYPHEFSGGQRQRIVIARALITNPKVIIADEPIASLDISIQAQVVNLLKDLCKTKKIGLIFIAHDLSMVEYIADSIIIMHYGRIVERGKTEKIFENPIHPYTISLFDSIPKISNANEKFKSSNFELTYLNEQSLGNPPILHEVAENHHVLATEEQFNHWINK
ncbi:ATP-binding cassette domain-containing protein [[Mycoplasma] mobile]|uniref:Oligopeptide ABC transporter ATP-binding protein n=1 Tax=Mycoplasma mobile (strain ATCC 43663 / 163K / NCTC 11711) TaxID=267748 RepID=Q6KHJ6_MYCM1|nr:ATP-binding cassette domain-containing protein [[Mycoplasma] mobile]AAT27934.1 oligopeptide ABC transporter ATP-binding protein [Mycoplasma mobile 163K]